MTFSSNTTTRDADFVRSLVNRGHPVGVLLSVRSPGVPHTATGKQSTTAGSSSTEALPQFGSHRCTTGDHSGRWIAVDAGAQCKAQHCSGSLPPISGSSPSPTTGSDKQWLWVPYDCYYHLYTASDVAACSASQQLSWIHAFGDVQLKGMMQQLSKLVAPDVSSVESSEGNTFQYSEVRACNAWN